MAARTPQQDALIKQAYSRMRAIGIRPEDFPDVRRNGDVFVTFSLDDLFPFIALAESGKQSTD